MGLEDLGEVFGRSVEPVDVLFEESFVARHGGCSLSLMFISLCSMAHAAAFAC